MKIAILRTLGLGDSIVYSAVIKALNEFGISPTIFSGLTIGDIYWNRLKDLGYVKDVIRLNPEYNFFEKIYLFLKYYKHFDYVFDTRQGTKRGVIVSNFWSKFGGVGFRKFGNYQISIDCKQPDLFIPLKEYKLFKAIGILPQNYNKVELIFPVLDSDIESLKKKITKHDFDLNEKYVTISFSRGNNLSRKLYVFKRIDVIKYLIKRNLKVVLVGSQSDKKFIDELIFHDNIINAIDLNLTIWESGALIKNAVFHLGINSGPIWMSLAIGQKTIVLNGPTGFDWVPPIEYFPNVINLRGWYKEGDCYLNPCDKDICKYSYDGYGYCLNKISNEDIIKAIDKFLEI